MKLKGAAKNMKPKTPILLAVLLCAALTALRAYQSLSLIDPSTGFFTEDAGFTVPLFYALAACTALLVPLICYLCPLSKAEYIAANRRPLHALACLFLAVGAAADCLFMARGGGSTAIVTESVRNILSQNSARLVYATWGAGFLACISLLICAVSFAAGRDLIRKTKLLHLFPALWALCRTMRYFTVTASYLNNTSLLLCIFADVFLMLFLYEYARKVSGIAGDLNSPSFLGTGLACMALQLASGVSGALSLLPGRQEILHAPFALYRFAAALFCVTAVAVLLKNDVPDRVPAADVIETYPLPQNAPAAPEQTDEA